MKKRGLNLVVPLSASSGLTQNVVVNPTSSQAVVQPAGTNFSANHLAGIRYVVPGYNFSQCLSSYLHRNGQFSRTWRQLHRRWSQFKGANAT